MADIRYYGGKVTISSETIPTGHSFSVISKPSWVVGDTTLTGNSWSGKVTTNDSRSERNDTLEIEVTTLPNASYEGTASVVCAWTVTQEANPKEHETGVYITMQPTGITNVGRLDFALATGDSENSIVAEGSIYTDTINAQEVCRLTGITASTQPIYMFYKANTAATIYIGVGSGPMYQRWLNGTAGTGQAIRMDFTTYWQSSHTPVPSTGDIGWTIGSVESCPFFAVQQTYSASMQPDLKTEESDDTEEQNNDER